MLAMIVHAIALVLDVALFLSLFTDAQQVLVVSVGREGEELALGFSPEVVYANVGDQVQFQFYPLVGICFPLGKFVFITVTWRHEAYRLAV